MRHSRLWLSAAIIALVVLGGFAISVPHTEDVKEDILPQSAPMSVPSVSLSDSFKNGEHTITGALEAQNACTDVSAQATYVNDASGGGSILVALSMPEDPGVCLQIPARVRFSATIAAPAGLPITVTVNGATATTTS